MGMKKYNNMMVRDYVFYNFSVIEKVFRRHHPEFDGVPLSKTKLILEMQKLYVKGQRENVLLKNEDEQN